MKKHLAQALGRLADGFESAGQWLITIGDWIIGILPPCPTLECQLEAGHSGKHMDGEGKSWWGTCLQYECNRAYNHGGECQSRRYEAPTLTPLCIKPHPIIPSALCGLDADHFGKCGQYTVISKDMWRDLLASTIKRG